MSRWNVRTSYLRWMPEPKTSDIHNNYLVLFFEWVTCGEAGAPLEPIKVADDDETTDGEAKVQLISSASQDSIRNISQSQSSVGFPTGWQQL